jgi:hypothetical protein
MFTEALTGPFAERIDLVGFCDTNAHRMAAHNSWIAADHPGRAPVPCAYDHPVVLFLLERLTALPADRAWQRLTDWPRHAGVVPLTRVTVRTPPPTGQGTVFVARSGVGPLAFDDPMEVTVWQPPEGESGGKCRLVKHGSFVTGWAEIEVHPHGADASRVVWREDLRVRRLPGFFDRPLGLVARRMFGRAVDGLLASDDRRPG